MITKQIITWLLEGDVSIQYQTYRDLLSKDHKSLQNRIEKEGFGLAFLSKRHKNGYWGRGFYQPKWASTHYTLLDLRNLCISPKNKPIKESIDKILNECKSGDGGIYPNSKKSDVCVNGMFLNYASYFKAEESQLKSVIDSLLLEIMADGGFNCRLNRSGAIHSSLHSTLSVLEGCSEYENNGYRYRLEDVKKAIQLAKEFILIHQLFLSDMTGKIIDKRFLQLSYPRRWRYDVLSALDYFQYSKTAWDERMQSAIEIMLKKRNKNGVWNVQAKHSGETHFDMEKAGQPSRWNTLRVLRVLKHFRIDI
ncbi:hypothetical protein [Flavivirga spongiicola]|uniref:Uncharacterized protein n=1 Tax=Flavivirga spongiicola TaxID=421621 RepID=A0ABU7XWB8_9FLAO|nr:hypothetical protein [Flavivirga sp. MEBiC05379]MDO5980076.1 hypothetical protein [Flavivirga sp. MEBiC05379]